MDVYDFRTEYSGASGLLRKRVSRGSVDACRFGSMRSSALSDRDETAVRDLRRQFGYRSFERRNIDLGIIRRLGERGALSHVSGGPADPAARYRLVRARVDDVPDFAGRIRDLTDPKAVQTAIDEFEALGRDAFLARYGFGRAKAYFLVQRGAFYDSKAIVGAAYGHQYPDRRPLRFRDFSGGEATVRPLLDSLGFEVVDVRQAASVPTVPPAKPFDPKNIRDARRKVLREIAERRGQARFRRELLEAYGRRCVISGCDVEAALEAAHISPYLGPRTNRVDNGLLLRADLHTLFDLGLIGIGPDLRVRIARALADTHYSELEGRLLREPVLARYKPSAAALDHHRRLFGYGALGLPTAPRTQRKAA